MIDLYTWGTPNGKKASIACEEMGVEYKVHPVDIMKNETKRPEFLKISPNGKIPTIVDGDAGLSLMESGAILFYLANKTGKFLPSDPHEYWRCVEWMNWQVGGFGPMLGQANHFLKFNKGKSDYAEKRYGEESARLYAVLDKHLGDHDYVAGKSYSIADMMIFPWATTFGFQNVDIAKHKNIVRWYKLVAARPAVQRGWNVPSKGEIPKV
ncbi:glutathione S-transferase family protein [Rhizobiaceae bacterium]|nr:glutathione S-transferase family protein [Rhizobiaceae bacterium]